MTGVGYAGSGGQQPIARNQAPQKPLYNKERPDEHAKYLKKHHHDEQATTTPLSLVVGPSAPVGDHASDSQPADVQHGKASHNHHSGSHIHSLQAPVQRPDHIVPIVGPH
ncbi:unnamed protein product [Closterium sp. Naga37s-1]|nr:unnamed protein product [Closterium sp. Naga37s-1]